MRAPSGIPDDRPGESRRQAMLSRQRQHFVQLLRKVWSASAFYREYYADHGIRERDLGDLGVEDLPFTSKRALVESFDRAVTDSRLRRDELERWLDESRDPRQTFPGGFRVMHSSGSSGTIGLSVYSRADWQVMNAVMAARLPQPENHPQGRTRVAFYRVAHGHFAGITTAVDLPRAVYDTLVASVLDPVDRVIDSLHRFQPHRLTGYSSSIGRLAELAIEGRLRIDPRRIFVSGDLLTADTERRIRRAWCAPICNLYGASESLFLGVKNDDDDEPMRVMEDLNVLEVLDESGRAVAPGDEGRVVLTNLYNHTLPVLRYELGDRVTRGPVSERTGFSTIAAIRPGKASDALPVVLDSGAADTISWSALTSFYAPGLERVQFVQQSVGDRRAVAIRIDYVARGAVDDEVRAEFGRILRLKGAASTAFDVRRVPAIAPDPVTGKVNLVRREVQAAPRSVGTAHAAPAPSAPGSGAQAPRLPFEDADLDRSIAERFARMVAISPDLLALRARGVSMTYAALDRAANRVAHAILARRDVGTAPVALVVGLGPSAIVSILGALKAGRFYVPIDAEQPGRWIASLLDDAGPSLVVTDRTSRAAVAALVPDRRRIVDVDDLGADVPDDDPGVSVSPGAPAYVIYTSGSTGRPKGAVHDHRDVLHQTRTYAEALGLGPADCLTLLHSHAFSASRLDIFPALLSGAALVPVSIATAGFRLLAEELVAQEVTVLHWVPTAFAQFAASLTGVGGAPRLRWIVLGSEAMTRQHVELYRRHFAPGAALLNRYGTSETGTIAWRVVDAGTELAGDRAPVGRPVGEVEALIVDAEGREAPRGQAGEIAVRSRFTSAGYWRRPDLTAASFVPDPAPRLPAVGGRIYRTGDLGCLSADGELTHLGRTDFQVKVRGHRVELGAIERVLLEHPGVAESVAVVRGQSEDPRLIAYFVASPGAAPARAALRRFVEARLPQYMVPLAFVALDALPRTAGGKVDRGALPPPDVAGPAGDGPSPAPRGPLEEALARIWAEILKVGWVGARDSFFDLGGHSLHAARIVARVAEVYGVSVPLRDLFESPTVEAMAESLSAELARSRSATEPPRRPA